MKDKNEDCTELKNIKYQNMLLTNSKTTEKITGNIQNIETFLNKEILLRIWQRKYKEVFGNYSVIHLQHTSITSGLYSISVFYYTGFHLQLPRCLHSHQELSSFFHHL